MFIIHKLYLLTSRFESIILINRGVTSKFVMHVYFYIYIYFFFFFIYPFLNEVHKDSLRCISLNFTCA